MIFNNVFDKKKVFITGHTGFKGSWLSIWLTKLGAEVTGYALAPPTDPSNFVVSKVGEMLDSHNEGDIRDASHLHDALCKCQPDVVFHLAAQPIVRDSYELPRETFDVNVMGTCSLLDGIRALNAPCAVVVITSDKCYENKEQVWGYCEADAFGGHDPYSASKGCTELVVSSYRRSFFHPDELSSHGVKLASARAGNVIGGGDWAKDRIVTDIARCLANGQTVPVRNPNAVRPWQHVLEPLSGYLHLAAKMLTSEKTSLCDGWNFGPLVGDDVPVKELVEKFCARWEGGRWEDVSQEKQLHEANVLRLNIEKAIWKLGWRPVWSLDETVSRTSDWYRRYYDSPQKSMLKDCLSDIEAYTC